MRSVLSKRQCGSAGHRYRVMEKKILVIGSTVADVIIELKDKMPATGEDSHVKRQYLSLGGCACNVYEGIRRFGMPCDLFSPVGEGPYGDFIKKELKKRGIPTLIPPVQEENGCCYCFVEPSGERTFVSWHGTEYRFRREWLDRIDTQQYDTVYICGLEIEEETGENIVAFLEKHAGLRVFFAPGPRLKRIPPALLQRIYATSPILHLNRTEALEASGCSAVLDAALSLYQKTGSPVVVTLGADGCCCFDGKTFDTIPARRVRQVNTNGAGDAHAGALIACLERGDPIAEAVRKANDFSAEVVCGGWVPGSA